MGGDGGSITKRTEMVKTKKRAALEDPSVEENNRWTCCAISSQPLRSPTAICALGNLYNRQSVVDYLLLMKTLPKGREPPYNLAHIRKLEHIRPAKLHFDDKTKIGDAKAMVHFSCPVTGLTASGKYRFIYMTKCGCVLAEKAYQQVPSATCLSCGEKLTRTLDLSHASPLDVPTSSTPSSSSSSDKSDKEEKRTDNISTPSAAADSSGNGEEKKSTNRLVEDRARREAEQAERDANDAAAAPDFNAVDYIYVCVPADRLRVLRRQLIAKREMDLATKTSTKKEKKSASTSATATATTTSDSAIPGTTDSGKGAGTKRSRDTNASTTTAASSSSSSAAVVVPQTDSSEVKKKRKADVPRPPTAPAANTQKRSTTTAAGGSKGGVKSAMEGRSEVFKSLFLPKDAHLRPSVPNFTSTKPASAMPTLI